jgi:hypothetical protein
LFKILGSTEKIPINGLNFIEDPGKEVLFFTITELNLREGIHETGSFKRTSPVW